MKIATFYTLAEPEKLSYPYLEAIESCCQYSDVVITYFASNKNDNEEYRKFEQVSHDKIVDTCSRLNKEAVFIYEDEWPSHGKLPYKKLRGFFITGIQKAIDLNIDFLVKVDADNVFPYDTGAAFREFIENLIREDYISFSMPRKTVVNKDFYYLNQNSRDTYGFNLHLLKEKSQDVWLEKTLEEWLRYIPAKLGKDYRLNNAPFIPYNYDCFFFDKQRIKEFWKLSYDLYRFNGRFNKDVSGLSEEEMIRSFATEKFRKAIHSSFIKIQNHDYLESRIAKLTDTVWGYNNFGLTPKELKLL